jgi:hypothetical protein
MNSAHFEHVRSDDAPIRTTTDIHQGVLSGNVVICGCRVEDGTKTTAGLPPVRMLDVWIEKKPPERNYKLIVNGNDPQGGFPSVTWLGAVA